MIVPKWGANYLVMNKGEFLINPETIFFGDAEVRPGTKITKFGVAPRTSFEMEDGSFLKYEGTLYFQGIKYCAFNAPHLDSDLFRTYRYVFAIPDDTDRPQFLLIFGNKGARDIDCMNITLLIDKETNPVAVNRYERFRNGGIQ